MPAERASLKGRATEPRYDGVDGDNTRVPADELLGAGVILLEVVGAANAGRYGNGQGMAWDLVCAACGS